MFDPEIASNLDPKFARLPDSPWTLSSQTAPSLPSAPPTRASLFDKDHRRQTLLTLGAALAGGRTFGDSLANVTSGLAGLQGGLEAEQRKTREFGGPDNAFEIITDPRTGERTYRPVEAFQGYLRDKQTKPKDVADINGRVMFALQQLPEQDRAAAYAGIIANPERYGVDPASMPPEYDPNYAAMTAGMGMTVSQAMARNQAASNAENLQGYRAEIQKDRETRTGIYRDRATATTRQGDERIAVSRSKGGGKPSGGGARPKGRKVSAGNSDLSYLLN